MNMQNLMAQAQKMQREISSKKAEIDSAEFVGKSEWVEVVFNGKKELLSLKITDKITLDSEDLEMLEDMTKVAISDALSKIDKETKNKLGAYGDSLGGLM